MICFSSISIKPPTSSSKQKIPGLCLTLPKCAQKYSVREVTDGDTLILANGQRVRLLGIDSPEIKVMEQHAEKAKRFTQIHCRKMTIWLDFDDEKLRADFYGRLLGFVWIQDPRKEGFINLNQALVAKGLARLYEYRNISDQEMIMDYEKQARYSKKGLWKRFQNYSVIRIKRGFAYHKRECNCLVQSANIQYLPVEDAINYGLHPCRKCRPDSRF